MSGNKDPLIIDPKGATNQSGLRDQNARVVLSFLRRHGEMPSAEIARRSGLSAQTVSNIVRALEGEGLIRRGKAIKGKVGKPSVPMALNPDGVMSLGLNIGRRSAELVLVDFHGHPVETLQTTYAYPAVATVLGFLEDGIARLAHSHPEAPALLTGIGVAQPNKLWNWLEIVNAPEDAMRKWRDLDIGAEIHTRTGLACFVENDMTAACVAEHLLGRGAEFTDFAYIFMGAFVGGGLVLNGKVVPGRTGNTAALGPLPVPDGKGGTRQLLNTASLYLLEDALSAAGEDPEDLRRSAEDWSAFEPLVAEWVKETSHHLAIAATAIASVVEVEAILIDGAMPDDLRARLTRQTAQAMQALDLTGLETPRIEVASVGRRARSVGAALLPIHARYFLA